VLNEIGYSFQNPIQLRQVACGEGGSDRAENLHVLAPVFHNGVTLQ